MRGRAGDGEDRGWMRTHTRHARLALLLALVLASALAAAPASAETDALLLNDVFDSPHQGSNPASMVTIGGTTYFAAADSSEVGLHGIELWKTDGTTDGTELVKDIRPGNLGSSPQFLTNVNGTLFFRADDGTNGRVLWKSDGTADGTVPVKLGVEPGRLKSSGGLLYFVASGDIELWESDGTSDGTFQVKEISAAGGSDPQNMLDVDGTLYFMAAADDTGYELWKTDGTPDGTVLVKDINDGPGHSFPSSLTRVGTEVYFSADDGPHGT